MMDHRRLQWLHSFEANRLGVRIVSHHHHRLCLSPSLYEYHRRTHSYQGLVPGRRRVLPAKSASRTIGVEHTGERSHSNTVRFLMAGGNDERLSNSQADLDLISWSSTQKAVLNSAGPSWGASQQSQDGAEEAEYDETRDTEAEDGYEDFQFHELKEFIMRSIDEIKKQAPNPSVVSRSTFDTFWREAFDNMTNALEARSDIPESLFISQTARLPVQFTNKPELEHFCCECDLPDDLPKIIVNSSEGQHITKKLFMRRLTEALYGWEDSDSHEIGQESDRLVIRDFGWMRSGYGVNHQLLGALTVYCDGFNQPLA